VAHMAMKKAVCAYCGVHTDTECEHVFLYVLSIKARPRHSLAGVGACILGVEQQGSNEPLFGLCERIQ
jgi:hypothetical protein